MSLFKVITAMTDTGREPKIGKQLKEQFAWRGFNEGRWVISRPIPGSGLVAFQKGSARPKESNASYTWKFSPSPAARHPPAELSCEPSPRSDAGCVVC